MTWLGHGELSNPFCQPCELICKVATRSMGEWPSALVPLGFLSFCQSGWLWNGTSLRSIFICMSPIISKVDHLCRCMDRTLFPPANHSFITFAHLLVWLFYWLARVQRRFWVSILFPHICLQISSPSFCSPLSLLTGPVVRLEFAFVCDVA